MSYTTIINPNYMYKQYSYAPIATKPQRQNNNIINYCNQNTNRTTKPISKTDLEIQQLKKDFKLAKDEQGCIGKAWNGIKNLFKTAYSSDNIEDAINRLSSDSTDKEIDDVRKMIAQFRKKQDVAVDTVAITGATIAAGALGAKVGGVIGSVICPGAGTIVGTVLGLIGGTIVGAVTNIAISQLENMTDNVDNNAWHKDKKLGKQAISGAIAGFSTMLFGGIARKISGLCKTSLGLTKQGVALTANGTANVTKTVGLTALADGAGGAAASTAIADSEYLLVCATNENLDFSWSDFAKITGISAITGGLLSAGFGAITGYRNAKIYNNSKMCINEIAKQNTHSNNTQIQKQNIVSETLLETENGACKIKTTKSPKGKLISEETYFYDKDKNITKYIYKQGGMITEYNYTTKEISIPNVKFADGTTKTLKYSVDRINPDNICFTQRSISENYKDIVDSFKKIGWQGKPVDVIRTKSGQYISMDNRRIVAAREAGIEVHAIIHDIEEPLTIGKQMQFAIRHPEANEIIAKPQTWGEAIYNRLFQNGFLVPEPKTRIGTIWNKIFNIKSGMVDLQKAHSVPTVSPDPLISQRRLHLFNLYKEGKIPYSSTLL